MTDDPTHTDPPIRCRPSVRHYMIHLQLCGTTPDDFAELIDRCNLHLKRCGTDARLFLMEE